MALSLTAEQKSLSDILSKREQIIIPPYQRPYSWGKEECYQLYQDFLDAYNLKSDYFMGNIILAVSEKEKKTPTKLWLLKRRCKCSRRDCLWRKDFVQIWALLRNQG